MKIALSFYGQPRYLDNTQSYDSHKKFIFAQNVDVDVFIHYWFDKQLNTFNVSDGTKIHPNYIIQNAPEIIENMYAPKIKIEEKPREFLFREYDDLKEYCSTLTWYSENQFYNMLSQIYSFEQSMELVSTYSKQTNIEYDFVISSRLDVNIVGFPNIEKLQKNYIYSSGRYHSKSFVDALMIIDNKFIGYKPYSNYREVTKMVPIFAADEYKKAAFIIKYGEDPITNHSALDLSLIRGVSDFIGQF